MLCVNFIRECYECWTSIGGSGGCVDRGWGVVDREDREPKEEGKKKHRHDG